MDLDIVRKRIAGADRTAVVLDLVNCIGRPYRVTLVREQIIHNRRDEPPAAGIKCDGPGFKHDGTVRKSISTTRLSSRAPAG